MLKGGFFPFAGFLFPRFLFFYDPSFSLRSLLISEKREKNRHSVLHLPPLRKKKERERRAAFSTWGVLLHYLYLGSLEGGEKGAFASSERKCLSSGD